VAVQVGQSHLFGFVVFPDVAHEENDTEKIIEETIQMKIKRKRLFVAIIFFMLKLRKPVKSG